MNKNGSGKTETRLCIHEDRRERALALFGGLLPETKKRSRPVKNLLRQSDRKSVCLGSIPQYAACTFQFGGDEENQRVVM